MTTTGITTIPTCNARAGYFRSDYGLQLAWCQVQRGLRSFRDRQGVVRYFCAANGHRYSVERQFGIEERAPGELVMEYGK